MAAHSSAARKLKRALDNHLAAAAKATNRLDVVVDGQPVQVPAGIGIDRADGVISPLHTHDTYGAIHIESPVQRQFSLGEFLSDHPSRR